LQKDPNLKKKKKDVGAFEEEIPLMAYPDGFTAHIRMRQKWLRMKNSNDKVSTKEQANHVCSHFEQPKFGNILYQIFPKDVQKLVEYMSKRP
jgi:hypothetical protein